MNSAKESWEKFLNPETLKQNLISASVFLAAYEMLKEALIDQLRGFYADSLDASGEWQISDNYREKVLSLDKKEMVACAKWFFNSGAIDSNDLLILKEIAEQRNIVAHELPAIIGSQKQVSLLHLRGIYAITSRIDNWWIREIEVPTNPDFDEEPPTAEDLDAAYSMRMMIMSLLIEVAEGDDSKLAKVYQMWMRHFEESGKQDPSQPARTSIRAAGVA